TRGEGIAELAAALTRHRADLEATGGWKAREVSRARAGFLTLLRERLLTTALERLQKEHGALDVLAERIAAREADPYALAEAVAARVRG
ncbi:MAG TPA: methylmalonyl Co-A mutase-associated GTPase MeaB, partial [Anaeromyxobacteraceae bacterium]|nr:methylmalonyl Co-A mutase-associated GTPase MeaB [Anaeromyxobacteraceae bacterium]